MANIIAVVNQKGGVGKTTTTVNITAALRALGKRVLLCDFDAQANATSGMGVDKNTASPNVYDVLINGAEPQKAVVSTKYGVESPLDQPHRGQQVAEALQGVILALHRPSLCHGDPPQRPPVRSTQPRNARTGLRPLLPRGRGLSDAGPGDLRAA